MIAERPNCRLRLRARSLTYGLPGAAFNTAGRITKITSQMGTEERQYGKLGETVYEKKTVTTFTNATHPSVYETRFFFETFGVLSARPASGFELRTRPFFHNGPLERRLFSYRRGVPSCFFAFSSLDLWLTHPRDVFNPDNRFAVRHLSFF